MESTLYHPEEQERLKSIEKLGLFDSCSEGEFDEFTLLASKICETPISLFSVVEKSRLRLKSKIGFAQDELARVHAFCSYTILQPEPLVIENALNDQRFCSNPFVINSPNILFYAGVPILTPEGYPLGTLSVLDKKPRTLNDQQMQCLIVVAKQIQKLILLQEKIIKQSVYNTKLEYKKTAIHNLSEAVTLHDADFNLVEANPSASEIFDLPHGQLNRHKLSDLGVKIIKEDGTICPEGEYPAIVTLKTGLKKKNVVLGLQRPKRRTQWIQVNSSPIYIDGCSKPQYVVSNFKDITTQKNTELIIQKNQADLIRVLNGIPAMISHWDLNLNCIHINKAYLQYFSLEGQNTKGKSFEELHGGHHFEANQENITKVLGGESVSFEQEIFNGENLPKNILVTYLPEYDAETVIGFFIINTDVTELKKLEIERQLLIAKMAESAKMSTLGEMAGGIAHELNTPLAVVITKASMLIENFKIEMADPTETIGQLEKIKNTAEKIAKIVRGLRLFSRNSKGDPAVKTPLKPLIESTLDICQQKLTLLNIKVKIQVEDSIHVFARAAELSQVFLNLVINSIDAILHLSEKWISISAVIEKDKVRILIVDSGSGIPKEVASKIMNPFFTTKEVGKGTGLGLSISKGIIESHEGSFYYDPRQINTCFVIELPQPHQSEVIHELV